MPSCQTGWCRLSFGRNPFSYKGNRGWQEIGSQHHLSSVNLEQKSVNCFSGKLFCGIMAFSFSTLTCDTNGDFLENSGHKNAMFNRYILNYCSLHFNKENPINETITWFLWMKGQSQLPMVTQSVNWHSTIESSFKTNKTRVTELALPTGF